MSLSSWGRGRWVLLCAAAVAAVLWSATPALGTTFGVKVNMQGKDLTNPEGDWWYFNTVTPLVSFAASQAAVSNPTTDPPDGYLYTIDHSPFTVPGLPSPGLVPPIAHAPVPFTGAVSGGGAVPLAGGTLDMRGWLASQAVPYSMPGQSDPVEGIWFLHVTPVVHDDAVLGVTTHAMFGIDITPPHEPSVTTTLPGGTPAIVLDPPWQEYTRRDFFWIDRQWEFGGVPGFGYDALSGDSLWHVYLNSSASPLIVFRNWHSPLMWPYREVSIEDLRPGRNVVDVRTVDYAGNESATALRLYANVDTDTPVIRSMSPAGGVVSGTRPFTVDAVDSAGISAVRFEIDGVFVASDASAPFSISVNTRTLANGTHAFKATVHDMIGDRPGTVRPHVTSSTASFRVDNTPPRVTILSAGPSPFFPIRRDGYLDDYRIRYSLSKDADVVFEAYNSSGTRVRSVTTRCQAGTRTFVWNGARDSGGPAEGTYTWRLRAVDVLGNSAATARRSATVRSYIVVRVGAGVRIEYH